MYKIGTEQIEFVIQSDERTRRQDLMIDVSVELVWFCGLAAFRDQPSPLEARGRSVFELCR